MFYIYKWFRKDNNEIFYIGKGHKNRYKDINHRNQIFKEYLDKYDCDVEIVEYFENEEKAFQKEKELITKYKKIQQCKANLDDGGKGGCHFVWTKEMKEYQSKYNPMKRPEQRERMSKENPMKNPEVAKKVALKNSKAVIINGERFDSLLSASKALKKSEPTIRSWCKKGINPQGQKCYYENNDYSSRQINSSNAKSVIIDDKHIFNSIKEAADFLQSDKTALGKALRENRNFKGHKCKYANQQPS